MILPAHVIRQIQRRDKHQLRRPVRRNRRHGNLHPCGLREGHTAPVKVAQDQPAELHILITSVRREPHGHITPADLKAEGHPSLVSYAHAWMTQREAWPGVETVACPYCDPDENVIWNGADWIECPHCVLGEHNRPVVPSEEEILDRWQRRHAHRPVWVVTFEPISARYLSDRSPRAMPGEEDRPDQDSDPNRGYSSAPAGVFRDEPAAVSDDDLRLIRADADERWARFQRGQRREAREQRDGWSVDERIRAAEREAMDSGVDVSRELWMVTALRAAGRPFMGHLESVERKAYRRRAA